jgi:glycosyltransferase involved in cell wall biosynthesis
MRKIIDLNYHMHLGIFEAKEVLKIQQASIGFVQFLQHKWDIRLVKHMGHECETNVDGVPCYFFKRNNAFFHIPFKTHRFIKKERPDIILIQGLIFPLQVIVLKIFSAAHAKIMLQHHGERPFKGVKKWMQKTADRYIDAYIFTGTENAREWIDAGIIPGLEKCSEVLEASTSFQKKDKEKSKRRLAMQGNENFLWVGRLINGKDPVTVIKAFEQYLTVCPGAKLYMIFQTNDLLPIIEKMLIQNDLLRNAVILVGTIQHDELETWYSAADFYISASHRESTGYALLEAMACGCIPVVTNIPAYNKITANGKYGFLFEPGNVENLSTILIKLSGVNREAWSISIQKHFEDALSFQSIAHRLGKVCDTVLEQ